jgi:PIN domain nuclease of toxin-antitoxin system
MKFLIDTHILLWWLFDSPKLSSKLRAIIAEPTHQIFVSSASAWEIATKHHLGKLPEVVALLHDYQGWLSKAGCTELAMTSAHAIKAGTWASSHKDPFDRMLAAQSAIEMLPLCSTDNAMHSFGIQVIA